MLITSKSTILWLDKQAILESDPQEQYSNQNKWNEEKKKKRGGFIWPLKFQYQLYPALWQGTAQLHPQAKAQN